jgi:hypothetical protein
VAVAKAEPLLPMEETMEAVTPGVDITADMAIMVIMADETMGVEEEVETAMSCEEFLFVLDIWVS